MSVVCPYPAPRQETYPTNITPIRAVRPDVQPSSDGLPSAPAKSAPARGKHVTMIADDVVEEVAFTCGMAAMGLYTILERRVGRDGMWTCKIGDLAQAFNQNDRHVRAAIAALEEGGFLSRETVYGRGGVPNGVRFTLPKHMRTYDPEVTPEVTPEVHPEVHPEVTPEPHAPVLGVVITSSPKVDTRNGVPPVVPRGDAPEKPPRRKPSQSLPDDFSLTDDRRAYAISKGFADGRIGVEFERFVNHAVATDRRQVDWDRSWQNWVLGDIQRNGAAPAANGHAPFERLSKEQEVGASINAFLKLGGVNRDS